MVGDYMNQKNTSNFRINKIGGIDKAIFSKSIDKVIVNVSLC